MRRDHHDPRGTRELIALALSLDHEDHARWQAVEALHYRGTREVLEAAQELCGSRQADERELGADILGQLGVPERSHAAEAA